MEKNKEYYKQQCDILKRIAIQVIPDIYVSSSVEPFLFNGVEKYSAVVTINLMGCSIATAQKLFNAHIKRLDLGHILDDVLVTFTRYSS